MDDENTESDPETLALADTRAGRWLPTFVQRLEEPFLALRYRIDVSKDFAEIEVTTSADDQPAEPTKKKGTLKKLMKKGTHSATDTGDVSAPRTKVKVRISEDIQIRLNGEIDRIVKELSGAVDSFVALLCRLADIRTKEIIQELAVFAPYVMLDNTITKHPKLAKLKLADNTVYSELGRTLLQAHTLATAAAMGQSLVNAKQRQRRINELLDVWLTKRAKHEAQKAMPVVWTLDPGTHEVLKETFLRKRAREVMRDVPLLMIGVLHVMCLDEQRDRLVREVFEDSF